MLSYVVYPPAYLVGCSGGVYGLILALIANLVIVSV